MKETIPVPGAYSSLEDNPLEWNGSDGLPHALRRITFLLDDCIGKADMLISDMTGSLNPSYLEWERTGRSKAEEKIRPLFYGTDAYTSALPEKEGASSDERRKLKNASEAVVPYSFLNCVAAVFNTDFAPGTTLLDVEKDLARLFMCTEKKLLDTVRYNVLNADELNKAADERERKAKEERQKKAEEWDRKCLEDYIRWENSEERQLLLSMISMGQYSSELRKTKKYAEWKAQAKTPPEGTPAYYWHEKLEDEKKRKKDDEETARLREKWEREDEEKRRKAEADKLEAELNKPVFESDDDEDDDWAEGEKSWEQMMQESHEQEQWEKKNGWRETPNPLPPSEPWDPNKMGYFDLYPERRYTYEYDYDNWKKLQKESVLSALLGNGDDDKPF